MIVIYHREQHRTSPLTTTNTLRTTAIEYYKPVRTYTYSTTPKLITPTYFIYMHWPRRQHPADCYSCVLYSDFPPRGSKLSAGGGSNKKKNWKKAEDTPCIKGVLVRSSYIFIRVWISYCCFAAAWLYFPVYCVCVVLIVLIRILNRYV